MIQGGENGRYASPGFIVVPGSASFAGRGILQLHGIVYQRIPNSSSAARRSGLSFAALLRVLSKNAPSLTSSPSAGDDQELDDAGVDQIVDPGFQWGQYEYVTNIGFTA
ncbi:hypothetical protein O1Q96_00755 (plasmid) [Streptomyces sp. Qhu-G9]|nr:hypothetical protein [Streptomyces aurantiacus]WAU78405.1 hypothetical protein O1Q96_00755 [Streptomyces aurantiacus]